ncbi:MAG: hypothetical protein D6731_25590 [Planctomycetota bacterium]|nr:MAG: hypothetical protein D6731_25590 [Planctomycetota bacterium]
MLAERYAPTGPATAHGFPARERFSGASVWIEVVPQALADEAGFPRRLRRRAALRHPSLLRLLDFGVSLDEAADLGVEEGATYLVHAQAEGEPFDAAALSGGEALSVVAQALAAFACAHERGLFLGDLGAERLLLVRGPSGPRLRCRGLGPLPAPAQPRASAEEAAEESRARRGDLHALGRALQQLLPAELVFASAPLRTVLGRLVGGDAEGVGPGAAELLEELFAWRPRVARSFDFGFPEVPLVGREPLVRDLSSALEAVLVGGDAGAPRWVWLRGEVGSGRSRLVDEATRRLRLQGVAVVEVRRPEAVAELVGLARRAPTAAVVRDLDDAPGILREAVFDAVRRTQALPRVRLAWVTTLTPRATHGGGGRDLAAAAEQAPPRVLEVEGLERPGLRALLAAILSLERIPERLLDAVEGWCGGNPALARLALERLLEAGALERAGSSYRVRVDALDGVPGPVPAVAPLLPPGLSRRERRVLRALAVAPGPQSESALRTGCGLSAADVAAASEALCALGVARRDGQGRLVVRRRVVAAQVLDALPRRERDRLHREAIARYRPALAGSEVAEVSDETVAALAHHSLALPDVSLAAQVLPEAARRARARGERRRAAHLLSSLLALNEGFPAALRVRLQAELGEDLLLAGRPRDAERAFATALASRSPSLRALDRARLHRQRAAAALGAGECAVARAALARAREQLDAIDERNEAWTHEDRALRRLAAQEAHQTGRQRDALQRTGALLRELAAEGSQPTLLEASLWNLRGLARFHLADLPRARKLLRRSLRLCRSLGHEEGELVTLGNLGCVLAAAGDRRSAHGLHRRSLRLARRCGDLGGQSRAYTNLGNLASGRGRHAAARRFYRRALTLDALRRDDRAASLALASLGDLCLAEHDPRRALPYLERAAALATAVDYPYGRAIALANAAHAHLQLGELLRARERAAEALELRRGLGDPVRRVRSLASAARIELRLGQLDAAAALLAEADAALAEVGPAAQAERELARAEHAAAEGALGRAEDACERCLEACARAQALWTRAEALGVRSRALLAGGRAEAAERVARRAEAEAAAVGAEGLAAGARVLAARARCAGGASPAELEGLVGTVREARSFAVARELAELEREAAACLARIFATLGRSDEARAEVLAARRAAARVLDPLPRALRRAARALSWVRADLEVPGGGGDAPARGEAKAPAPARGEGAAARAAQDPLGDVLRGALPVLRCQLAFALRREGATFLEAGARAVGDVRAVLPPELLGAAHDAPCRRRVETRAGPRHALLVPAGGRRGVLALLREGDPFAEAEFELAAAFAAALAPWLRPAQGRSRRRASLRRERWGILGRSRAVSALLDRIERFAAFSLPVLVRGESGTGKELVARALHRAGPRADGPFVVFNAAAVAESLLTVELFGAAPGAYTGATGGPGVFELADGGTLFLDEVGATPPAAQAMLLRVLEAQRVRRVGDAVLRPVDVRVVSATHEDLRSRARSGEFREDLYYRLCGLSLEVPPLRARRGDAVLLARHFLREAQREGRGVGLRLAPDALDAIAAHRWPGNVRELRNAIERAVALCEGPEVCAADLGLEAAFASAQASGETLAARERDAIAQALAAHPTLTAAAAALGIDRRTLRRRMERYGLKRPGS